MFKPFNIEPETREEKKARYKLIDSNYELCPHCSEAIMITKYNLHNDFECPICFKWIKV